MSDKVLRKVATTVGRQVVNKNVRTITAATEPHRPHMGSNFMADPMTVMDTATSEDTTLKTIHDLPGPSGYPVVGTAVEYFRKPNRGQMHQVQVGVLLFWFRVKGPKRSFFNFSFLFP